MSHIYNPADWYWRADDGRLYSSAARAVVSGETASFADWLGGGGVPTIWPRDAVGDQTQAALDGVLMAAGVLPSSNYVPTISRAQAKIQLRRAGLREAVDAAIAEADPETQDWYVEAGEWQRDHPRVVAMAALLKLTPTQADDLFRSAALIDA